MCEADFWSFASLFICVCVWDSRAPLSYITLTRRAPPARVGARRPAGRSHWWPLGSDLGEASGEREAGSRVCPLSHPQSVPPFLLAAPAAAWPSDGPVPGPRLTIPATPACQCAPSCRPLPDSARTVRTHRATCSHLTYHGRLHGLVCTPLIRCKQQL